MPCHDDGAACVRWQGGGHAELLEGLGGAERRYAAVLPLSAVMVVLPPRDTRAQAGQGATDARKAPSMRVRLRTSKPGRELRAKRTVSS